MSGDILVYLVAFGVLVGIPVLSEAIVEIIKAAKATKKDKD